MLVEAGQLRAVLLSDESNKISMLKKKGRFVNQPMKPWRLVEEEEPKLVADSCAFFLVIVLF